MKKIILLSLLLVGGLSARAADTLNNWQVYLDGEMVAAFHEVQKERVLELSKLQAADSLVVTHFCDTPNGEPSHLVVLDVDNTPLWRVSGIDNFIERFAIPWNSLSASESSVFKFILQDSPTYNHLLFELRLNE